MGRGDRNPCLSRVRPECSAMEVSRQPYEERGKFSDGFRVRKPKAPEKMFQL